MLDLWTIQSFPRMSVDFNASPSCHKVIECSRRILRGLSENDDSFEGTGRKRYGVREIEIKTDEAPILGGTHLDEVAVSRCRELLIDHCGYIVSRSLQYLRPAKTEIFVELYPGFHARSDQETPTMST